jgi:5-methylcytosine-specific restriction endonuclease McrA
MDQDDWNKFFDWFCIDASPERRDRFLQHFKDVHETLCLAERSDFYDTDEWRETRYEVLKQNNGCCQCCGRRPNSNNPLHVDHIKPRSKFPWLALDHDNLQVLCADCNLGKSNIDQTDWRS